MKTVHDDDKIKLTITFKTYDNGNIIKLSKKNATFSLVEADVGTLYNEAHDEQILNTNSFVQVISTFENQFNKFVYYFRFP